MAYLGFWPEALGSWFFFSVGRHQFVIEEHQVNAQVASMIQLRVVLQPRAPGHHVDLHTCQ